MRCKITTSQLIFNGEAIVSENLIARKIVARKKF